MGPCNFFTDKDAIWHITSLRLPAFGLPVSNGSEAKKQGKNTSIPKIIFITFVKPPTHSWDAFNSLPPQFAMASYLNSSRLISSLGSALRRPSPTIDPLTVSAEIGPRILKAIVQSGDRGGSPEIPVPYETYMTLLAWSTLHGICSGKRMNSYRSTTYFVRSTDWCLIFHGGVRQVWGGCQKWT